MAQEDSIPPGFVKFTGELDPPTESNVPPGFVPFTGKLDAPAGGTASDLAKSLKVGTQRLPGMVTGLADLPFALAAGARPFTKAADALGEVTGFQPGKWADETKFSAGYEQGKKAVDDAWKDGSAGDIALAYLKNPGYTANQVVESAPSMVAGGLAGRALMGVGRVAAPAARAGGVGPAVPGLAERALGQWAAPVAAGVGEGAVTAGQQMAQYQGEDQQTNALASLGAGAVTGLVGVGAGRVANKLGLETAETAIAKAGTGAAKAADDVPLSAKRRILGGMVSEALLQELPQSAQEQMWQNWADGKPLMEGVARAATEGAIAGGVMGAGANVSDGGAGKRRALAEQQAKQLSEAEAEALRADPSRAWTTEAGAVDPNQPAGERAVPPEAPELTTSPGAGVARDGMDFTRDVDTSGLSLQDPAELERQRAATVDYQTGDTTPQWDTQPGAAPVRSGLDMPAPDFDTGALGFDPRPLSERMGLVPAANTPLTKAAALSVDTGASPVQFLGATGRDMQLRQTGPGVANESNVIDVQGRVIEDRAIGTPRRLTAQDGARESGAIAFQDGVPRSEIAAIPNIVARAEQLRGYDEAAQKAAQPLALPAPSNLREGLERIRAQRQEAANAQAAAQQAAAPAQALPAARAPALEAAGVNSGPGTDAGNGFKQGHQSGERYRVGVVDSVGGAVSLEKRLPAGTAATFYVGKDGNLIDGDTINLIGSAGRNRLWIPTTQLQASQAAEILDEMGKTALNDPKRADAKRRLKSLVTGQSAVEAAGPAPVSPTTGVTNGPEAAKTQQGSAQPAQAGGPQAGAATATASASPAGGNRVQAAGLTNGAQTQNTGAQAATAAGPQAQAPQTAVARPDGWRKSMLRAAPIARAMGIDPKGKRLAQVVAEIDARDTQTPTTPAPQPAPGPVRLGRDNRPLSEGGKPFKTRNAAGDAKKLQPMMRVVSVEGGYALAEKTPAQLAAQAKAARRLAQPRTGAFGEPISAHAFVAAAGGLHPNTRADLNVGDNPRIGNRRLFAGPGRGMTIEQATEMLIAEGYLSEGASHNDAYALIKTSLTRPQYNADGIERIAQAESDARFEDYLAAHEEAAAEGDTDPFGMADNFTAEELDDVGYTDADPALQAEVAALTAQADAMGIDTYAILDDIARTYADATQDEFNAKARDALAQAIARGNQDGGSTAAQAAPAAEPAQEPGLTAPTRADIEAQQEARDKAEREEAARQRAEDQAASQDEDRKRIAQASVRAAAEFELGQNPLDSLTGQGGLMFSRTAGESGPEGVERGIAAAIEKAVQQWQVSLRNAASNPEAKEPGMATPAVLRIMGAAASRLVLPRTYLRAILDKHGDVPASVFENLPALLADPLFIIPHKDGGLRVFVEAQTAKGEPIAVGVSVGVDGRIHTVTPLHDHDGMTGQGRMARSVVTATSRIYAKNKEALAKAKASAEASPGTIPLQRNSNGNGSVITRADVVKRIAQGTKPGDPRFSFAGARAATADTHALVTAQDRLDAGEDPETVRQETGWFKGVDGRMRFEISDADALLKADTSGAEGRRTIGQMFPLGYYGDEVGLTVGRMLHHPALFAAYPAIADINVKMVYDLRGDDVKGSFNPSTNTITLNQNASWRDAMSTLLHEIQHGIQNIEGFAMGDSPERLAKTMPDVQAINDAKLLARFMERGESAFDARQRFTRYMGRDPNPQGVYLAERNEPNEIARMASTPLDAYKRNAGEVEARNTQARQKLTADQRRATSPSQTADVADADVIVVFNGKEMANAPMPANAAPDASATVQPLRTQAATIRSAITKAYGKLLGQLESKGLVTLTQTEDEAIEAAAQARADKTGQPLAEVRASLMGSVSNSIYEASAQYREIAAAFIQYANADGSLQFGRSNAKDIETISAEVGKGRVTVVPEYYEEGDHFFRLYVDGRAIASMSLRPKTRTVEVNTAAAKADGGGKAAMAVAYEWAYNNDYQVVPNGGLTKINTFRWTESMLSAALRHGTTRHMRPEALDQRLNGWFRLSDTERLILLLQRSYENTIGFVPSLRGAAFDQSTGQFVERNGDILGEDQIRKALGDDDVARSRGIGLATVKKALVIGSALQDMQNARRLAQALVSPGNIATVPQLLYSSNGAIQGFFDPQTGQSFLIADNLTAEAAPGVLMHEVGIHMAADGSMKALFNRAAMMLKLQKGNPFIKQVQARMDAAGETSGEEAAAYIAEAYENDRANAPASVRRWLADLLAAVKAWMFKKGIMGADRLTVADIAAVARANARSMARGGGETGGQGFGPAFSHAPAGDQTQTDAFKRWFGEWDHPQANSSKFPAGLTPPSQVVDGQGRPLVVYHATNGDFSAFETGRTTINSTNFGDITTQRHAIFASADLSFAEEYLRGRDGANVMPLYMDVKAPVDLRNGLTGDVIADIVDNSSLSRRDFYDLPTTDMWQLFDDDFGRQVVDALKAAGYDGAVMLELDRDRNTEHEVWVAFDAKQVKSAIGNQGTFDPTNPDIRFSRAGVNTGGQAATGWDAPTPTGFDDVIYKLQDKNIDLKRVVESITKATGKVSDSINAYLKEELFHKRAAKRVADFGDRELKPLMNKMRLAGLSMEDVEEYLHARHAKEANAVIAQRNPGNAGLQDGGSGMTNAAADNYFAKLDPAQRRKLEAVAKSVDAIIEGTRKLYVSYGLEDQAVVDGWANMYQHYIPLMREDKDGGMGTGQGFSVKGKETKGRTGSTRKVVDILANVAMQREKLIVRGEKNIVAQALVGLAQANPNPDFWEVRSQAPTERVFDPKTGVVVERPDPLFKSRENVAVAKVKDANGKVTEQMVVFNEDNPRAVRMAAAMKNLDAGNLEGLLGVSAKITRYFAAINTQYNPVFGVVNLVRDVQGAMVNLGTTPLAGQQGKIAKDTLSALRGIYGDIRKTRKGGQATSQWSQLWEQMQDDGGTTGYRDLFKTSADRANDLKSILNPDGWMDSKWGKFFTADGRLKVPLSMAQKGATEIFGWLSDYNEAMENGVRLAAYKAALDKGMSREQAASLAKNLTVNFNRKGQAGMQAGAVYAFFNAAMQGTARIGQTLFDMDGGDLSTLRLSKTGKAVVYGGVMLGVMQALALSAAGFDDDDPPEFVRERSLIIPTGDKTYVSIPMPLGLHVIPGIGRHATEFALSGFDKPAKRAVSMVGMFADAFNPIGNAGLSMQTIAPTALDPLVALSENKDWTGKPIARVSSNKAMPGHTQWKDTATGFSKVVAEAINWISGGNEYVAGAFSPTPDQIDYLIAQLGGGVAREAAKVQQTITTAMSGETLPTHKIPLVGRFVGNAASQASQGSAFYANLNKLNELETEIKGLRKDGRFDEAAKLTRENPQSMMIAMANRAERDVQRLRREKRELIANDASREQVRAKEDQITAVMTRLNEAVERRKAQAAR